MPTHSLRSRYPVLPTALLALALCFPLGVLTTHNAQAAGGGGGGMSVPQVSTPKTPEQVAADHYRAGERHNRRAAKAVRKAADADSDKRRERHTKRAQKEFEKAVARFQQVLKIMPTSHEAANELGFALRGTGNYEEALRAYNYALQVDPNYLPAIEYRAQALMHLGQFDQTKQAYMRLFNEDADLAAQLMNAMTEWQAARSASAMNADERAFADWVSTRKQLTSFAKGSSGSERDW